ncbi:oxygenase MpaB family protein [Mucilaginibacter jinjuensis]|uniref:Oxygenase MpaB family protein n=1 Tax=Mucilaginibacter jinjuensis TaxID=1176721 RepID=A0ABY7T5G0_9SPHI|nr:oxygenase MpaB family protein [Mucilaginibacter jinjuensis]WCT11046.1 oxygenase MpaB family protein [Mucilaginibacter jinjuensis]
MKYFVKEDSIVREIWGKADTVLFIFAASAAEFALNKAVDWLYFTGKLPADPLGRLFSTVTYAQRIIFSTNNEACAAIDQITAIHKQVEHARGSQIPDWAYRDVLFMLIDYSIRAYELLECKLTLAEKEEVFHVFCKVGLRMGFEGLPTTYNAWKIMREIHLKQDLQFSNFTVDLFKQYRQHLGGVRFPLLKLVQALMAPSDVTDLLKLKQIRRLKPLLYLYKISSHIKLQVYLKNALLPVKYKIEIQNLDTYGGR